jgi:hypothetical protein
MPGHLKVALATAGVALVAAAPAHGAVTIGSSLATTQTDNAPGCNIDCTVTNLDLIAANQAPGGLRSPVTGTVTSWRLKANAAPNVALRVLRPGAGTTFTGVATSGPAGFLGPGISGSIPTSLPIQAGDAVGLESTDGNLILGANPGANSLFWNMPVLANGSTRMADGVGAQREVLVQAVVEPTNTLTFGKPKLNKKKGNARMTLTLPNPGQLSITGAGVKISGLVSGAVQAGTFTLRIKATGKKDAKLDDTGKVTLKPRFSFTPTGGEATSQAPKVKLKQKT